MQVSLNTEHVRNNFIAGIMWIMYMENFTLQRRFFLKFSTGTTNLLHANNEAYAERLHKAKGHKL